MELRDRFQGAMVGLAVGDALGRPTEFITTLEAIHERFGPEGVTDFVADWHPAGTYTDDTQMSLCVARALLKAGRGTLDELMTVMAEEFVAWDRSPENDRAPGVTCRAGCEKLAKGVPWREAGVAESKGCGSAMRTAPIGLHYLEDEDQLIEVARASSLLTHGHPTALAAAAGTALLVAWAARGEDPPEYPARLAKVMIDMADGKEVASLVQRIPEVLTEPPEAVLHHGGLGEAWTGEEAVASALYCFCRSPEDFRQTVTVGANTVGDSDSIACIAGAISGAFNGISAVPKSWREQVENSAYLHEIAVDLLASRCAIG
ncbi:MAG: ADP-ribosylglycohydrolase family protein [Phycisphaerales bacterium]|nr:MAG: ADP-ribosylglycohydrolase family protein [Phycisphaerales bacterium]